MRKSLLLFFLSYTSFTFANFIPPPPPLLEKPPYSDRIAKEIPNFLERHPEKLDPREEYELALLYIQIGEYEKARSLLYSVTAKEPENENAWLQLGYLELWEKNYTASYSALQRVLALSPCNKYACGGLEKIGLVWAKKEKSYRKAESIFLTIQRCFPDNPDPLIHLGVLYLREGDLQKAKMTLEKCLQLFPENEDATVTLGMVLLREKRYAEAQKRFEQFPENVEAQKGLARIQLRNKSYEESEARYKKILSSNPQELESKKELGQALSSQMKFSEAKELYGMYLTEDPSDEPSWNQLFEVKMHTDPGAFFEIDYTSAKEDDPTLQVPVVRDYYFFTSAHYLLPTSDHHLLDLEAFYYQQKEKNIYISGINYNAAESGAQVTSRYLLNPYWAIHSYLRLFYAWQLGGDMQYPFKASTECEPGISIIYSSDEHIFSAGVHVESFIIKDFANIRSKVLGLFASELHYLFRPDVSLHPQIEMAIRSIELFDGNYENLETLFFRFDLPNFEKRVQIVYQFENSHFKDLTSNYFSYDQQFVNAIGTQIHFDLSERVPFDIIYTHSWQLTKKLIQPIGDFIFIANRQLLTGNKITGILGYRVKDTFRMNVEGHYFRDTLPYRDWNIKGSLLWFF